MTSLVSLVEIKDFLSIKATNTEEDGRLANIAIQASSLASSYCGRDFPAKDYVEYFDGGISAVFISQPPINRVDEVSQFNGVEYQILGGPGINGEPIAVEGQSHSITAFGNPTLSTRVKKFNRSSGRFSGSAYLLTDSNSDWDFGVDPFTIETQVRLDSISNAQPIVSSLNGSSSWELNIDPALGATFKVVDNNIETISLEEGSSTEYVSNKFYHIALVRDDEALHLYRDGTSIASIATSNTIPNFGTGLSIAKGVSGFLTGYLDDFKISHISEYTSDFTAPTYPTRIDENTKLMIRFDGYNNSTQFSDVSRRVNEFNFYPTTGEISFNTGFGGGTPKLSFFRPLQFNNYPKGIKVSYNGGYAEVPEDLKLAVLEIVKLIYKGKSGSESVRFQGESITSHKLGIDDFPPQIRRVLNLYRLIV
jgi:hypothetical protein